MSKKLCKLCNDTDIIEIDNYYSYFWNSSISQLSCNSCYHEWLEWEKSIESNKLDDARQLNHKERNEQDKLRYISNKPSINCEHCTEKMQCFMCWSGNYGD